MGYPYARLLNSLNCRGTRSYHQVPLALLSTPREIYLWTMRSELSTGPLVPSLVAGASNTILLSLFIFAAGPVSGGHLNPTITIATFFSRLSTFPRAVLYVTFQVGGAGLGGLLVRASLDTRDYKVGGCTIDTTLVKPVDAFAIEFTTVMALIFLSFGVGLDPRQRVVFGPTLGPIFVGLILGVLSFGTGFVRPGYSGVCMSFSASVMLWISNNELQPPIQPAVSGRSRDRTSQATTGFIGQHRYLRRFFTASCTILYRPTFT